MTDIDILRQNYHKHYLERGAVLFESHYPRVVAALVELDLRYQLERVTAEPDELRLRASFYTASLAKEEELVWGGVVLASGRLAHFEEPLSDGDLLEALHEARARTECRWDRWKQLLPQLLLVLRTSLLVTGTLIIAGVLLLITLAVGALHWLLPDTCAGFLVLELGVGAGAFLWRIDLGRKLDSLRGELKALEKAS